MHVVEWHAPRVCTLVLFITLMLETFSRRITLATAAIATLRWATKPTFFCTEVCMGRGCRSLWTLAFLQVISLTSTILSQTRRRVFSCSRNTTPTVHCCKRPSKSCCETVLLHPGPSGTTTAGRECAWQPSSQTSVFVDPPRRRLR